MVLGALGELGSLAIRGLARNLFAGFYERGISANAALAELREAGLGYKRQDFLADFRADRPGYDLASSVSRIGFENIPRESILKPQYYGTPDKYSFVFKSQGVDMETGEETTRYFAYHRNSLDTRANMEAEALDWAQGEAERYGFDFEDVRLVEGYINPIWA